MRLVPLVVLLLLVVDSAAGAHPNPIKELRFSESSACGHTWCPSFTVSVYESGCAVFVGRSNIALLGRYAGTMPFQTLSGFAVLLGVAKAKGMAASPLVVPGDTKYDFELLYQDGRPLQKIGYEGITSEINLDIFRRLFEDATFRAIWYSADRNEARIIINPAVAQYDLKDRPFPITCG
jgi:hypothetical protein